MLFPVEVMPQDPAKPVELNLAMEFGICRDICIPAEAKISLDARRGLAGTLGRHRWLASTGCRARAVGRRAGDPELRARDGEPRWRRAASGDRGALSGSGSEGADVFIEAPEGIYVPHAAGAPTRPGGAVRFEVDLRARVDAQDSRARP